MATHQILSGISAGITELKKNPMDVVKQGDGGAVAILNRNAPVFYAVPAAAYELLMDRIDDLELAQIVREREGQPARRVNLDDL